MANPRILFLFLDGVGLGDSDPAVNPLAAAEMPVLRSLLGDQPLAADAGYSTGAVLFEGAKAALYALDASLGVEGVPQSATGQAVLLTGLNVPALVGEHYGPKPDARVAAYLNGGSLGHAAGVTLFHRLGRRGRPAGLVNAYPPRYFQGIESGRRLYSSIPLAVTSAGFPLRTLVDLQQGQALSADFTGEGWRSQLGLLQAPVYRPRQAGEHLARMSQALDLAFFEYWLSDYTGHKQDMRAALRLLAEFDQVLDGLMQSWDFDSGLVLITSDHGNLEDLTTRRHTLNPVPLLVIGAPHLRRRFGAEFTDLTQVAPAIQLFLKC